jgi:uncharacterized protein
MAWGFHSPDSDYDARFIYVRPEDDYLSLWPSRDVIETPIEGLFDVNGWDIGKALRLMARGNSVVHEWIASPLTYRAEVSFMAALVPLASEWRSAYADVHHYHGLLATQRGRFIDGREFVKLKKYFYVIRPAIALQWVREKGGSPPMDLPSLLAGVDLPVETVEALEALRAAKRESSEMGEGARIPALDNYIESQSAWARASKPRASTPHPTLIEKTNSFFRAAVRGALG